MTTPRHCPACNSRLSVVYRDPRTDELWCPRCEVRKAVVSYAEEREQLEGEQMEMQL